MVVLARDENRVPIQGMFSNVALEETYDATVSASTEIVLNASTTFIEVTANAKPIFMKWGTSDVSSTDFDSIIPQDSTRGFKVPLDTSTGALFTAVNFIEQAATATLAVIEY